MFNVPWHGPRDRQERSGKATVQERKAKRGKGVKCREEERRGERDEARC